MHFALEHHRLDPNPLNHYGPGEKLSKAGWVSHSFTAISGQEYRVAKAMGEADPKNIHVSYKRFADSVTIEHRMVDYSETQMTVYASSQDVLDRVIAAVTAMPKRNVELTIMAAEDAKMASQLARGSNHRLIVMKPDDDYNHTEPYWVLSIEDNVAAVQIKLSLP